MLSWESDKTLVGKRTNLGLVCWSQTDPGQIKFEILRLKWVKEEKSTNASTWKSLTVFSDRTCSSLAEVGVGKLWPTKKNKQRKHAFLPDPKKCTFWPRKKKNNKRKKKSPGVLGDNNKELWLFSSSLFLGPCPCFLSLQHRKLGREPKNRLDVF